MPALKTGELIAMGMIRCESCAYFKPFPEGSGTGNYHGWCFGMPPTMVMSGCYVDPKRPWVKNNDFCSLFVEKDE